MDFKQVEERFVVLKSKFTEGNLNEADFKTQLEELMIQDEKGDWWMIGYETGRWYRNDGEDWVLAEPPGHISKLSGQKAEADRKAKEEADRLAAQKAEAERKAKQTATAAEIKAVPAAAPVQKKRTSNMMVYGIGAVVLLAVVGIGFSMLTGGNKNSPAATLTAQAAAAVPTAAPTLGIGSSMVSDKDGMTLLYVPAGEFTMGSNDGNADEKSIHKVYLDVFWIDKTEVTNKMYALCVVAGSCQEPKEKSSDTHSSYYGNSDFDNYPVIYVDWNMAKAYCEWADRRLPTEAEWEKTARGTDGRTYPWGSSEGNKNLSNYNGVDTTEVGKFPNGASLYGALDMAGNVWEWVNDWYSNTYYSSSPSSNPLGPDSGQYRVLRGGSWNDSDDLVRSANRNFLSPANLNVTLGFRCALSATP